MNPRISVALLSASMLAGCGFSDSSNYAGGAFLDAQGESRLAREEVRLPAATRSVEYLPAEGYPALPGVGPLVIGRMGDDSIRAVLAFDLTKSDALTSDSVLRAKPLQSVSFKVLSSASGSTADTTWNPTLRVRFVLTNSLKSLKGMLMGVEPGQLEGVRPVLDTVLSLKSVDSLYSIPIDTALSESIRTKLALERGWMTVILDPLAGSAGSQTLGQRRIQTESNPSLNRVGAKIDLSKLPDDHYAFRSIHLRASGSSGQEIGWWFGSGSRARMELDGEALRTVLHREAPAMDVTAETDNSYHILQARAHLGFHSWISEGNLSGVWIQSMVVDQEKSQTIDFGSDQPLGFERVTNTEAGLAGPLAIRCEEIVPAHVAECKYKIDSRAQSVPTRLAVANANLDQKDSVFWIRTDVPDRVEFQVSWKLRLSVASISGRSNQLKLVTTYLHTEQSSDPQYDSAGVVRDAARLNSPSKDIQLEVRSALSQVIVQKRRKVILELVPSGYAANGLDAWIAKPNSPSQLIDSVHVLVRPRNRGDN